MTFVKPTKEELHRLYVVEQKSIKDVADELGIGTGTAFNYMKQYGIDRRPQHRFKKGHQLPIEAIERRRLARIGKPMSAEQKQKISEKQFKGGIGHKKKRGDGYIAIYFPEHPRANKDGYIMEHDLVAECARGTILKEGECVHHINGIKDDNRLCNLRIMTNEEHMALHMNERNGKGKIKHHTVGVVNLDTGETFDSIRQAAKKYGVASTNISQVCRGKANTLKGCRWAYVSEGSEDLSIS